MFNKRQYLLDNGYLDFDDKPVPIGKYNRLCINCHEETLSYLTYCSQDCLHKELGDFDDSE